MRSTTQNNNNHCKGRQQNQHSKEPQQYQTDEGAVKTKNSRSI